MNTLKVLSFVAKSILNHVSNKAKLVYRVTARSVFAFFHFSPKVWSINLTLKTFKRCATIIYSSLKSDNINWNKRPPRKFSVMPAWGAPAYMWAHYIHLQTPTHTHSQIHTLQTVDNSGITYFLNVCRQLYSLSLYLMFWLIEFLYKITFPLFLWSITLKIRVNNKNNTSIEKHCDHY